MEDVLTKKEGLFSNKFCNNNIGVIMFIFVYEYVGQYCHGGYACTANDIYRSKELLAELEKKDDDICETEIAKKLNREPHYKGIADIINELFEQKEGSLHLIFQMPIIFVKEKILLNSFDCC